MPLQNIGVPNPLVADLDAAGHLLRNAGIPCAQVLHQSGALTSYPAASNTDAAAGTAVMAAQAASVSGDTIYVYRNATVTANLAKNGVNWWLAPGVTLTATSTANLFDDGGSDCVFSIGGSGALVWAGTGTGNNAYAVKASSANTDIRIQCDEIRQDNGSADITKGTIYQSAGSLAIRARRLFGYGNVLEWINGNCWIDAQRIESTIGYGLWSQVTTPVTGQLWVRCEYLKSPFPLYFNANTGAAARVWVDVQLVENPSGSGQTIICQGPILTYIRAEKILEATGRGGISVTSGAHLYLKLQKYSPGADAPIIIDTSTSLAFLDIDELDPSGVSGGMSQYLYHNNGTTYYRGMVADLSSNAFSGGGSVFQVNAGTLNIAAVRIASGSQAGWFDLTNAGGTLNVSADVNYTLSKTSGAITLFPTNGQNLLMAQSFGF